MKKYLFFLFFSSSLISQAQSVISGNVYIRSNGLPISNADIFIEENKEHVTSDQHGYFEIVYPKPDEFHLFIFAPGFLSFTIKCNSESSKNPLSVYLDSLHSELQEIRISAERERLFGISRLRSIEGTAIYEGKKNELILIKNLQANLASNNSRQIFAKVPGLNIWESGGSGIQMGIGARGLSPNRSSEFNMRQNGHDMSADALGYPEAYYTPPTEGVERIEIVRGAASLQYGTQFGGLVNFVMKKGPTNKKLQFENRQTLGSFGFYNNFTSLGGTCKKFNYYGFYQFKKGNGWRENSEFENQVFYSSLKYSLRKNISLSAEYTGMKYLEQQAGGLTMRQFQADPQKSYRSRNWFQIHWNMFAMDFDWKISNKTKLNWRGFGLIADKSSLGFLGLITRPDPLLERDLQEDRFRNFGSELRVLHFYKLFGQRHSLLSGVRVYNGLTIRKEGKANDASDPDFKFLHPDNLEHSSYEFPGYNYSFFTENIFRISPALSITPGLRIEHIQTISKGYYNRQVAWYPVPVFRKTNDRQSRSRFFPLFGVGLSYDANSSLELYSNISQNYRAINFNDLRIFNPNLRVDPNLKDETGYNADLGIRGELRNKFIYDVSGFYMRYNDRIASVLQSDSLFNIYRYRTNIANSHTVGIESMIEFDFLKFFNPDSAKAGLSLFINLTLLNAEYESPERRFDKKKVEHAPELIFKTGLTFRKGKFSSSIIYGYTAEQFSDASNAKESPTAIEGIIPAYHVLDLSASFNRKHWGINAGINNLTDSRYFTRRAISYPGPGIIPSDGRSLYLTVILRN